jgi:exopolysaccharide biosynthesis protein
MKKAKALFYLVAGGAYLYISTSLLLFHGPWPTVRSFVVDTLATTRHAYLLRPLSLYTLSNAEIKKHSVDWTTSTGVSSTKPGRNFSSIENNSPPVIKTVQYKTFKAQIVEIADPKRVHVAATKYIGEKGETVEQIVKDSNAILGVNGGAFNDAGWRGTGGIPMGTTIVDGKYLAYSGTSPIVGITKYGQLVCGTYTKDELMQLGVSNAVSFGPILVQNGQGVAPVDYSYQPRVAIGQKADGTMLLVVTSGREVLGANDLGATYKDIQNLMLENGAITAANLDGGSSATLVYQGRLLNTPADVLGARLVATAFVVK